MADGKMMVKVVRYLGMMSEQCEELGSVGGLAYLASLDVDLPDLSRVASYIETVKERSLRRQLIKTCQRIYDDSSDGGLEAREAIAQAKASIARLGEAARPPRAAPPLTPLTATLLNAAAHGIAAHHEESLRLARLEGCQWIGEYLLEQLERLPSEGGVLSRDGVISLIKQSCDVVKR